jgi:CHAT domain-containing protein
LVPRGIRKLDDIKAVSVRSAHYLYNKLIGSVKDLIAQKSSLIIVPDGALQSLPFSILVSQKSKKPRSLADHKNIPWLVKTHAMSVLPSVGSLKALRGGKYVEKQGRQAFLGIGDPRLSSPTLGTDRLATMTRGGTLRTVNLDIRSGGALTSRSEVSAELVRSMVELPDTAEELKQIAATFGSDAKSLFLRDDAREPIIRAIKLDDYKIVQFATHGLMAGDFQGLVEPALVLTPPATVSEPNDDGLLSASEITELKLNADWVVLSACNTAAPNGELGAEGLSGLAKSFFFAGARTLLVSHWEVLSGAAVGLTTTMFEKLAKKGSLISPAKAQQQAMLALMQSKDHPYYAHPMFWAPFVVVGEGGL